MNYLNPEKIELSDVYNFNYIAEAYY